MSVLSISGALCLTDHLRTQLHANRAPDLVEEEAMRDFDDWIESVVWFDPGT